MNSIFANLINNGIPSDVLYFLVSISFVTMIVTFSRYMLGLKLLGMYVVVVMVYAIGFLIRDYSLLSVGVGMLILSLIYTFSYFIKRFTVQLSLHSFARISLVVSLVSVFLLAIIMIAGQFQSLFDLSKLNLLRSFPVIMMVMLSEYFSSHQTQKGIKKSRAAFINSLVISGLAGLVLSLNEVESFLMSQPYVILTFILLTILFGRYKGLRLAEVFRFKGITYDEDDYKE